MEGADGGSRTYLTTQRAADGGSHVDPAQDPTILAVGGSHVDPAQDPTILADRGSPTDPSLDWVNPANRGSPADPSLDSMILRDRESGDCLQQGHEDSTHEANTDTADSETAALGLDRGGSAQDHGNATAQDRLKTSRVDTSSGTNLDVQRGARATTTQKGLSGNGSEQRLPGVTDSHATRRRHRYHCLRQVVRPPNRFS